MLTLMALMFFVYAVARLALLILESTQRPGWEANGPWAGGLVVAAIAALVLVILMLMVIQQAARNTMTFGGF